VPATLTLAAVRHFYWVGSPFIKATALTTASRVANGPGATSTTSRAVISPSFFEQQNASYDADTEQVLPMARTLLAYGPLSPAASAKETRRRFSSFQSTSGTDLGL